MIMCGWKEQLHTNYIHPETGCGASPTALPQRSLRQSASRGGGRSFLPLRPPPPTSYNRLVLTSSPRSPFMIIFGLEKTAYQVGNDPVKRQFLRFFDLSQCDQCRWVNNYQRRTIGRAQISRPVSQPPPPGTALRANKEDGRRILVSSLRPPNSGRPCFPRAAEQQLFAQFEKLAAQIETVTCRNGNFSTHLTTQHSRKVNRTVGL